jgi:hypothetical protein
MLKSKVAASLLTAFCFVAPSEATTQSYFLDQSSKLADGINYVKVTISDEGAPGDIDFTVEALQPLLDLADKNFGIQKFAFNVLGGVGAEARDVYSLSGNRRVRNGGRMDGFGLFDIKLQGRGSSREDPLTFSISGVDFDTIQSYVDLSTGRSPLGFSLFSAQVRGLKSGNCGGTVQDRDPSGAQYGRCVRSAYFGGNIGFGGNTSAVPAPPAVWLLGTGIVGLLARRFRSAKAPS